MNSPTALSTVRKESSVPRTAWELPESQRPASVVIANAKQREHFPTLVHWVATHRVADGWQLQRRFPQHLTSYRTRNRHLAELVSLGYLTRLPFRALTPNHHAYAATGRGVRYVQTALGEQAADGLTANETRDRERTWWHLRHELGLTEFALARELTIKQRPDLELLMTVRRHDYAQTQLRFHDGGERSSLEPDDQFVFRQHTTGQLVACFVELDHGTATASRVGDKLQAYDRWAQSNTGRQYLEGLYSAFDCNGRPNFRLLVIVRDMEGGNDERRLMHLFAESLPLPTVMRDRIWFTTVAELFRYQYDRAPLRHALWRRVRHARAIKYIASRACYVADRRKLAAEQLAEMPRVPLFPYPAA